MTLVIVDVEATCWRDLHDGMEIIEIGGVGGDCSLDVPNSRPLDPQITQIAQIPDPLCRPRSVTEPSRQESSPSWADTHRGEAGDRNVQRAVSAGAGEFQSFVRPVRNPILSDFCRELTKISQADVDAAPAFPEALPRFAEWAAGATVGSWGDYDRRQFEQDCAFHGLPMPFDRHVNIKRAFAGIRRVKPHGVGGALRLIGLSFEGTPHRGIDDARNIARIYRWMLDQGYTLP